MKLAALLILTLFSISVAAQFEENPDNWCREGFFTRESESFGLAKIVGAKNEKIYFFHDDRDDCPGGKDCRTRSYVIPGNEVIVNRKRGGYSCASYISKKGIPTVGWIETAKLAEIDFNRSPALKDWLGEWRSYDNNIAITDNKLAGWLNVTGDALWHGLNGNVNVGQLDYRGEPGGISMRVGEPEKGEFDCQVRMNLIGNYLVVADNMNCGGFNVSFSGVYVRKGRHRKR